MVLVLVIGDAHIPHRAPGLPPKFRTLLVPGRIATAVVTGNLCTQVRGSGEEEGGVAEWKNAVFFLFIYYLFIYLLFFRPSPSPNRPNTTFPPLTHPPQDIYDYLKSVCPTIVAARGEFDDAGCASASRAGDVATTTVAGMTLAVVSGAAVVPWGDASALDALQRRLGVDILVTGHSHELSVTPTLGGAGLRIDPGSATGAWAPHGPPSPVPSFVLVDVAEGGKATVYMYRLPGGAGSDDLKVEKLVFVKAGGGGGAPATAPPAAA